MRPPPPRRPTSRSPAGAAKCYRGKASDTVHIPLFEVQRMRGHPKTLSAAGGLQARKTLQPAA